MHDYHWQSLMCVQTLNAKKFGKAIAGIETECSKCPFLRVEGEALVGLGWGSRRVEKIWMNFYVFSNKNQD